MFEKITYTGLHHLAVGRVGEYWTKIALTFNGLDVYTTEVDNKGIDFVVRSSNGRYFDIQVKSVRSPSTSYVFISKEGEWHEEKLRENLYLALVIITDYQAPKLYLIPSTAWKQESDILKSNGEGENGRKKYSKPEWGINLSEKNMSHLAEFEVENQVEKMK
jgi:hypothetical protein